MGHAEGGTVGGSSCVIHGNLSAIFQAAGTPHGSQAVTRGCRQPISAVGLFLLEEGNCENQESDL